MSWSQHKLYWALSVIEEEALANFFRYIRKGAVRPVLVDEVNLELDKGVDFQEMFTSSEAILKITDNTCIELMVMWWGEEDLKCMIKVGHMEWAGSGAEWDVCFEPDGSVREAKVNHIWEDEKTME